MKVLNLYAGIGGNRSLWGNDIDVTAIEIDKNIAAIYKENFPNDNVIIADAHEYLLNHFQEFDFIWSSPPCPTHSRVRFANQTQNKPLYPSMVLYEEIIFLSYYFSGKWVVENVISYYEPLIKPQESGKHYFWSNFKITELPEIQQSNRGMGKKSSIGNLEKLKGFCLDKYNNIDKIRLLRNCVEPRLGLHIFKLAYKVQQQKLL